MKDEDIKEEPSKVYEQEDLEIYDTGKGYKIDVTGLWLLKKMGDKKETRDVTDWKPQIVIIIENFIC